MNIVKNELWNGVLRFIMYQKIKVLIISHNPITTFDNMGKTIMSLFSEFDKKELCQLYIYPTIPDTDKCESYFRITDKDVLKSYFKLRVYGKIVDPDNQNHRMFENESDKLLYRSAKNKRAMRMIARDVMWKYAHWFNKDLKIWIKKENPTCIFIAPGTARFIYDIALMISRQYELPIVTYIADDYYFVKEPEKVLKKIQLALLKRKIERLLQSSSHVITICKETEHCYSEKFGIPITTIMTGSSYPIQETAKKVKKPTTITYMGNIGCNRYVSLIEIGQELDIINKEKGTDYTLNIYSGDGTPEILSKFKRIASIRFCGFVSGDDFYKTFKSSELLLHVEAFDEKSIDLVKHSVSTKIADGLGSGVPLVAYGPSSVSSIKHLVRNKCALVATSKKDLHNVLISAFENDDLKNRCVRCALQTARNYHDKKKTSRNLYEIMKSL